MKVSYKRIGAMMKIRLTGELDHHCAGTLRKELDKLIGDKSIVMLELDLGGVKFMDSSGLGVILGRYRIIDARGGRMGIKNAKGNIDKILRMAGIYTLIMRVEEEMENEELS